MVTFKVYLANLLAIKKMELSIYTLDKHGATLALIWNCVLRFI